MAEVNKQKLTLDRAVQYEIKVPGHLDDSWSEWDDLMIVTVGSNGNDLPITILAGRLDQAALFGLLRRLYSLGLPLISVNCLEG